MSSSEQDDDFSIYGRRLVVANNVVYTTKSALIFAFRGIPIEKSAEIQNYNGHTDKVTCIMVAGDTMYSASADGLIQMWNLKTGAPIRHFIGHTEAVTALVVRGSRVYSGSKDGRVILWNLKTGKARRFYKGHTETITSLLATRKTLFGASQNIVRIWKASNGELLDRVETTLSTVQCLQLDSKEMRLFAAGTAVTDRALNVYDIKKGVHIGAVITKDSTITFMRATALGFVYCGGANGAITCYNMLKKGAVVREFKGHTRRIVALENFQGDLYSASRDGTVRRWDAASGRCKTIFNNDSPVTDMHIELTHEGAMIFCRTDEQTVTPWFIETETKWEKNLSGHICTVTCMEVVGNILYSGSSDATIWAWDLKKEAQLPITFDKHEDTVNRLKMYEGSLFSAGEDKTIRVYNPETGEEIKVYEGHTRPVRALALASGKMYSGDAIGVRVWRLSNGQMIDKVSYRGRVNDIVVEDKKLILALATDEVAVYDLTSKEQIHSFRPTGFAEGIRCVTFSAGLVYAGRGDGIISAWSLKDNALTREYQNGHKDAVNKVLVAGDTIYSASSDKSVIAWNRKSAKIKDVFDDHNNVVRDVALHGKNTLYSCSTAVYASDLLFRRTMSVKSQYRLTRRNEYRIIKLSEHYGGLFEFLFMCLLLAVDFVQVVSFAFQTGQDWHAPTISDIAKGIITFNLPELTYPVQLGISSGVVLIFGMMFAYHDRIEQWKFIKPRSRSASYSWLLLRIFFKLLSRPLFLVVLTAFVRAVACTEQVDGSLTFDIDPTLLCFSSPVHWVYVAIAAAMVLIYVPLCVRLTMVGNELNNIESGSGCNPFDFSKDVHQVETLHPLSLHANGPYYNLMVILVKMVLTAVSIIFSKRLLLISGVQIATAVLLVLATILFPPFVVVRANCVRWGLDFAVVWTFVCSLLVNLFPTRQYFIYLLPALMVVFFILGLTFMYLLSKQGWRGLVRNIKDIIGARLEALNRATTTTESTESSSTQERRSRVSDVVRRRTRARRTDYVGRGSSGETDSDESSISLGYRNGGSGSASGSGTSIV